MTDIDTAAIEAADLRYNAGIILADGPDRADDGTPSADYIVADGLVRVLDEAMARLAAVRELCDSPDDTQWWEVVPYVDPPNDGEAVEVHVVTTDRIRAALDGER